MQAERAAAIEAFHNYSAEKKAATQAAVAAAAQNTPTKAPKATPASAKASLVSSTENGTATPVKKGKGKATGVVDEHESIAQASDAATFSKKLAREAEKAVGNGAFLN